MLPRIVIPTDARIGDADPSPAATVDRRAHLVSRRLIPSNAKLPPLPPRPEGQPTNWPRLMVAKRLVPAGAHIASGESKAANSSDSRSLASHRLFDDALLTHNALDHKRTAADWLLSAAIHIAIVAALVIIPLFFTQAIDPQQLQLTYLVAPPLPAAPAPPPPPLAAAAPRSAPKPVVPTTAQLTMPIAIPKTISKPAQTEVAEAAPDITDGVVGGVPGGVPGGILGGALGGIAGGTPGGSGLLSPPPPPPPPPAPTGPLQVGGAVKPPHLIYGPPPEYPILAKEARIQGVVQIDAVIDQKGNVVKEHAVSGSGLLVQAALDAVSQWKYQPTYLNGKPYPVELAVNVTFQL